MTTTLRRPGPGFALILLSLLPAGGLQAAPDPSPAAAPIAVSVDATEASRHILHSRLTIPARPGPLTLVYPKWLPGEHGPTGPVVDIIGLRFTAGGANVEWRRDPADMFLFQIEVPPGASAVEAAIDFATPAGGDGFTSGASATARLMVLSWNQVLLYPAGPKADDIVFRPELRLPASWKIGSSLRIDGSAAAGQEPRTAQGPGPIRFKPVNLTTLVDAPLLAGEHFRTVPLSPPGDPRPAFLHMAADSDAALRMKPEVEQHYRNLVAEAVALFGARHYEQYHFLLSLSDHIAHFGLEHHESSDNRKPERAVTDDEPRILNADLLAHEMVHSWNGKYRRPAGLIVPDYRQPVDSSMLWIYEGLTNYLGDILAARSGLWTAEELRDFLAWEAARLDTQRGRDWRPLVDTGTAAQILYGAGDEWQSLRRKVDFYEEGTLLWLEVDTIIRQRSSGKRTLDDFCRLFHGGRDSPPELRPYTADELYATLGKIASHDWKRFFDERVQRVAKHPPLGGLEAGGWRLEFTAEKTPRLKARETVDDLTDSRFSIGLLVGRGGSVKDVLGGSPAEKAGLAPAMKLVAVNGRRFSRQVLEDALAAADGGAVRLELLTESGEFFRTHSVEYKGGSRYPRLVRDPARPDLLGEIIKPLGK